MSVEETDRRKLDAHFAGGVAWTAGAKWVTQVFSWLTVFTVARLLKPADFGISEMASYSFALTNMLAEFGVGTAVLQMQELEHRVLRQLHTFSCLLCTVVYLITAAAAPLIASFFHIERLTGLILFNNLAFFMTGFQAVPMGLMQRDLDYRRLSMVEAMQSVLQAVVTLVAAVAGLGYWSLILGPFVGKGCAAILVCSWKPISFAVPRWRDIQAPIRFGRQAAIARLAWACYTQADGIVIGRVLGSSVLGVYRMAMNLATAPAEKLSTLIMRSAGPLFAKVQTNQAEVRRYFLILTESLTLIEFPLMLGLGVVAPEVVRTVLGPNWIGLVGPLRWLVLFMTVRTLASLMEQVMISQRATRFVMRMSFVNLAVMPIAFIVAAYWKGTNGVAASWIVLAPVTILPLVRKSLQAVHLTAYEFAASVFPAVVSATVMVAALWGLRAALATQHWVAVASLTVQVAAGAAVYGAMLLLFFRERVFRYGRFLRDIRSGRPVTAESTGALEDV